MYCHLYLLSGEKYCDFKVYYYDASNGAEYAASILWMAMHWHALKRCGIRQALITCFKVLALFLAQLRGGLIMHIMLNNGIICNHLVLLFETAKKYSICRKSTATPPGRAAGTPVLVHDAYSRKIIGF